MDDDVKELLETAQRYRGFLSEKMGIEFPGEHEWVAYEANFLFPQAFMKEEWNKITVLAFAKWNAERGVNRPEAAVPPWRTNDAQAREHYTAGAEMLFLKLKEAVQESGILKVLTPIQRRLLEQHYFVVRFAE